MAVQPKQEGGGSPPTPLSFRRLSLRTIKVMTFDEADLVTLQASINAWLEARGEETFIDIIWNHDHPDYSALVVYTEE